MAINSMRYSPGEYPVLEVAVLHFYRRFYRLDQRVGKDVAPLLHECGKLKLPGGNKNSRLHPAALDFS